MTCIGDEAALPTGLQHGEDGALPESDAAVSTGHVLNYLDTRAQIAQALSELARAVRRGNHRLPARRRHLAPERRVPPQCDLRHRRGVALLVARTAGQRARRPLACLIRR